MSLVKDFNSPKAKNFLFCKFAKWKMEPQKKKKENKMMTDHKSFIQTDTERETEPFHQGGDPTREGRRWFITRRSLDHHLHQGHSGVSKIAS